MSLDKFFARSRPVVVSLAGWITGGITEFTQQKMRKGA
ncbi:hypothetical protein NX02_20315 [Sphingomonas sanxanigenens DSM 19645 = NX02]|uniref:Uncharacterized protein n=1 Tax=Sphingomonas sanxanigenens DSM 19645 = NX02 TaxID=1123269 RepID=W0AJ82_9SPHN|nr:hypothetical protein NX02_20315 [Sphingomonas sanxanigenens DSM 19645 = NX02]